MSFEKIQNKILKDHNWARRYLEFKGKCKNESAQKTRVKIAVWSVIWCLTDIDEWYDTWKGLLDLLEIDSKRKRWIYEEAYSGIGRTDEKKNFLNGRTYEKLVQNVLTEPYRYVPAFVDVLERFSQIRIRYKFIDADQKALQELIQ